jgi:hypothetical protein
MTIKPPSHTPVESSDSDNPPTSSVEPLKWIQLELIPLAAVSSGYSELLLWWNPDERRLEGEGAEQILLLIDEALHRPADSGSRLSAFELTDPLAKPSELAAILAQYFWVIPQPVKSPGLVKSDCPPSDADRLQ